MSRKSGCSLASLPVGRQDYSNALGNAAVTGDSQPLLVRWEQVDIAGLCVFYVIWLLPFWGVHFIPHAVLGTNFGV